MGGGVNDGWKKEKKEGWAQRCKTAGAHVQHTQSLFSLRFSSFLGLSHLAGALTNLLFSLQGHQRTTESVRVNGRRAQRAHRGPATHPRDHIGK